ncbi:MAG: vitamin K epoxide reductase family protein [bacterium]|nr:vitamin K epoxide reductase family protein [bacterium]
MRKKTILLLMAILGVIGLTLSIYLVQHHYALAHETGFCDFSKTVSCSLVNQSSYAELFHIPVALYGVLYFVIFLSLLFFAYRKKSFAERYLLACSLSGFLFVFYLLYAEWKIGAICPWCTIVHIDIFILFTLAIFLYKKSI